MTEHEIPLVGGPLDGLSHMTDELDTRVHHQTQNARYIYELIVAPLPDETIDFRYQHTETLLSEPPHPS